MTRKTVAHWVLWQIFKCDFSDSPFDNEKKKKANNTGITTWDTLEEELPHKVTYLYVLVMGKFIRSDDKGLLW